MSYSLKSSARLSRPTVIAFSIIGVLFVIGGALFGAHRYYQQQLEPVATAEDVQLFEVNTGEGTQAVANRLEEAELIRAAWAFSWYMRTEGLRGELQAGTYAISPHLDVESIARIITARERAETATVTILPERRLDQIRTDLINAGFLPDEVDEALRAENYTDHPALADKPPSANLEGYLYPETFFIDESTTAQDVVELSLDQMADRLTTEVRTAIKERGLSVHEGIILASIIEREVGDQNPQDRPQVAQVFYSRIEMDMRLESDITADYGAVLAGHDPRENPSYSSSYNTYQNDGLPPTPISNISQGSIDAIVNPAETEYLFFVSGDDCLDDGGTCTNHFAFTLEEHEQNIAQFCQRRCGN